MCTQAESLRTGACGITITARLSLRLILSGEEPISGCLSAITLGPHSQAECRPSEWRKAVRRVSVQLLPLRTRRLQCRWRPDLQIIATTKTIQPFHTYTDSVHDRDSPWTICTVLSPDSYNLSPTSSPSLRALLGLWSVDQPDYHHLHHLPGFVATTSEHLL